MEKVNNPSHYSGGSNVYEHVKIMEATLSPEEFIGAMKYNITKYLHREKMKGGLEDLRKAQWYMNRLVQYYSSGEKLASPPSIIEDPPEAEVNDEWRRA